MQFKHNTFNDYSQSVNTVRDIGVQFCLDLTFESHINTTVAKAYARAVLIHKCSLSKDVTTSTNTHVHPTLEYASVIWSPFHLGEIAKLESVQRRFTFWIAYFDLRQ